MQMKTAILNFIIFFSLIYNSSHAKTAGYAEVVFEFFDSGTGVISGAYGGTFPDGPGIRISVSPMVVLGDEPGPTGFNDFLSLPEGSSVTVGFINHSIKDGAGNDFIIREIGGNDERASVYISSDGISFTLLGIAQDNINTEFDLASIGYTENVNAIKIIGLDKKGNSPGFDVVNIKIFDDSIGEPTDTQRITILNSKLDLHIPNLIFESADGEQKNLWAKLRNIPNDSGSQLLFEVLDYGLNQTEQSNLNPGQLPRLNSNLDLHIAELIFLNSEGVQKNLFGNLRFIEIREGKFLFEVTTYGNIQ